MLALLTQYMHKESHECLCELAKYSIGPSQTPRIYIICIFINRFLSVLLSACRSYVKSYNNTCHLENIPDKELYSVPSDWMKWLPSSSKKDAFWSQERRQAQFVLLCWRLEYSLGQKHINPGQPPNCYWTLIRSREVAGDRGTNLNGTGGDKNPEVKGS